MICIRWLRWLHYHLRQRFLHNTLGKFHSDRPRPLHCDRHANGKFHHVHSGWRQSRTTCGQGRCDIAGISEEWVSGCVHVWLWCGWSVTVERIFIRLDFLYLYLWFVMFIHLSNILNMFYYWVEEIDNHVIKMNPWINTETVLCGPSKSCLHEPKPPDHKLH